MTAPRIAGRRIDGRRAAAATRPGDAAARSRLPCAGWWQWLVVLAALALCPLVARLTGEHGATAVDRARALMAIEQALGIDIERAVHHWAVARPALLAVASALYLVAHVAVAGWALIWTWFVRRDRFRVVRDTFVCTQGLLVALYLLVPTAPPRLVPGEGYADTVAGLWGAGFTDSAHLLQSPYAAMPSGHVAFALVAGGTFARLGDMRWLRAFGWAYPPVMILATVMTANHLLLDALAAAIVVAAAYGVASRRSSRR